MKRNPLAILIGFVLLAIFFLLLFVFQVRKSQVVVITTFGKPTADYPKPGPYLKWPWPIQKVNRFDQRIQAFEGRLEETPTADSYYLDVLVYVGWRISNPQDFFRKFGSGSITEAERSLDNLVRSAKNEVVGKHPFSDFISTNPNNLKFDEIERAIQQRIQQQVEVNRYGIEIKFLGIEKLELPESVTENVFERMRAERAVLSSQIENEGQEQSIKIRSEADRKSAQVLSEAEAEATRIRGEGEAEAARSFAIFEKDPQLAALLLKLNALEATLKDRTTLVLDQRTPPLDLLQTLSAPVPPANAELGSSSNATQAMSAAAHAIAPHARGHGEEDTNSVHQESSPGSVSAGAEK